MIKNAFQRIIYKAVNWFSVWLFMALPVPVILIVAFVIKRFVHLYYEKDELLFLVLGEIVFLTMTFLFNKIENTGFLHFPKLQIRPLVVCILLGIIVWAFGFVLYSQIFPGSHTIVKNNYELCRCILTFSVTPIAEELFFRGWILGYMEKRSFSKITIVLTVSLGFFFYHWLPFMPVYSALNVFVFSVLACCFFFKTRDLRYCILMHMTMNFIVSMRVIIPYFLDS